MTLINYTCTGSKCNHDLCIYNISNYKSTHQNIFLSTQIVIHILTQGGTGHLAIFTRMKGFWNIIATRVLKISKLKHLPQKCIYKIPQSRLNQCMAQTRNPQIVTLPFNWLSYMESYQIQYKRNLLIDSNFPFLQYIKMKYRYVT